MMRNDVCVVVVLESQATSRLTQLIEKFGALEITHEAERALSYLHSGCRPLVLLKSLTVAQAADLVERIHWIRPKAEVVFVTENACLDGFLASSSATVLTEPLREDALARLNELLERSGGPSGALSTGDLQTVAGVQNIGRYLVREEIGSGGEGVVYRAWDPLLRRQVAIKACLKTRLAEMRQLLFEGIHAGSLKHPNIVKVLDCVHAEDRVALVMDHMAGGDLATRLEAGRRLPRMQVYQLAVDIGGALQAVHGTGMVHGDIKPANVLIDGRERFLLADFGASHSEDPDSGGWFRGTPGFLPPEMFHDRAYGAESDVYGLGVLLYRALTGELPFSGDSLYELMEATLRQETPSCRWADPNPETSWILTAMMSKSPKARPSLDTVVHIFNSQLRELSALGKELRRPATSAVDLKDPGARPTASADPSASASLSSTAATRPLIHRSVPAC